MLNLRLCYDDQQFFATARAICRSQWVVSDADGNGVYNSNDEFASGFVLLNLSAGRQFKNGLRLQAGMDNLFNYRDINNLPNMPGRMMYISAQFKLIP